MWQKKNKEDEVFHLLWDINSDLNGQTVKTACGDVVQVNLKEQKSSPYLVPGCEVCVGVWHLVCTSVDEARKGLARVTDFVVLRRAAELTKSITLRKAIDARLRKLEKIAEKERKLRLAQQAYD